MIFSKCSPAILHSEKDLKIQANNKAQASTTKPGFQICHKYLSSFSLSLSQQYWQARWFCEVQVAKIWSVTDMTCKDGRVTTAGYPPQQGTPHAESLLMGKAEPVIPLLLRLDTQAMGDLV